MMPELFLAMDRLVCAGRLDEARKIQYQANEIIYAMCACKANLYAVMKEILRRNGMDIGGVRSPLTNVSEGDLEQIEKCRNMIAKAVAGLPQE